MPVVRRCHVKHKSPWDPRSISGTVDNLFGYLKVHVQLAFLDTTCIRSLVRGHYALVSADSLYVGR